jgi:hypothetical protein
MDWKLLLAYITGAVDQELLMRNAYLVTENRLLCQQITGRVRLNDGERKTLAELGKKLGRHALAEVAAIVKPETILAWHRTLVAKKFDGSPQRKTLGRRPVDAELEALVVRLAQENRSWGYDRIVGALQHLGYAISDQTVGNILKRHGIPPSAEAKEDDDVAGIHSHAHGRAGGHRFLYHRGVGSSRSGHILRPVLYSPRKPQGPCGRGHTASGPVLDDSDRPQRHHGGLGLPWARAVSHSRSRREALPCLSAAH